MAIHTNEALVAALQKSRILEQPQLDELIEQLQERFAEPRGLARHLIQQGWVTPYQVNQVMQGRGQDLMLGQYVLLERLGEGGMGQVFKARHQHLHRVVALKVIRKEHLAYPEAVRRFHREIQAAAQLSHPNIVLAYDADQVAGTHFFVMEFVDGVDLSTLLKQCGRPAIETACDCLRQAALGLQHAHERGMVHRDIKPGNLLAARPPGAANPGNSSHPRTPAWPTAGTIIKILDMGLARLHQPDEESASALTKEGRLVGTPDYMAPEQAVNAHTADIRADLYSLGCTGYQLLTGQVPFPGGTMMEKLLHHRFDQPQPIAKLRPEVSPRLAGIILKLMAKRPQDRFQTPGELAQALTTGDAWTANGIPVAQGVEAETVELAAAWTPEEAPLKAIPVAAPEGVESAAPTRGKRWLLWLVALALLILGLVLGLVLMRP